MVGVKKLSREWVKLVPHLSIILWGKGELNAKSIKHLVRAGFGWNLDRTG